MLPALCCSSLRLNGFLFFAVNIYYVSNACDRHKLKNDKLGSNCAVNYLSKCRAHFCCQSLPSTPPPICVSFSSDSHSLTIFVLPFNSISFFAFHWIPSPCFAIHLLMGRHPSNPACAICLHFLPYQPNPVHSFLAIWAPVNSCHGNYILQWDVVRSHRDSACADGE